MDRLLAVNMALDTKRAMSTWLSTPRDLEDAAQTLSPGGKEVDVLAAPPDCEQRQCPPQELTDRGQKKHAEAKQLATRL
jgi:hypothetical protein